jgi:hypothetical protein
MSKSTFSFVTLLFLLVTILSASAQTNTNTTPVFHTNLVFNANISLTAFVQRLLDVSTNRIVKAIETQHLPSRGLIDAIASAATGGSNDFAGAKLYFREQDFLGDATFSFLLRKGTQELVLTNALVFNLGLGNEVDSERNGLKGTSSSTGLIILSFSLRTPKASADLEGLSRTRGASVFLDRKLLAAPAFPNGFVASVVGHGLVGSKAAVFRGTITASGRKVEITEGP